jgi:hypothetical protein
VKGTNNAVVVSGNLLMARHELEHAASPAVELRRGLICVEMLMRNRTLWIPLFRQNMYKEWHGCFSIL